MRWLTVGCVQVVQDGDIIHFQFSKLGAIACSCTKR
jgi:hypothetical protein